MAKEQIEKTLVILEEAEVRQLLQVAQRNDPQEIQRFMMTVFIKKVEAALRRRCG
jgi:hypothetical protein